MKDNFTTHEAVLITHL
jgi:excinuclease UvrABC helicase subunit UvrB